MPALTNLLLVAILAQVAPASGRIEGQLTDTARKPKAVAGVVVFLCEAETGYPLLAATRRTWSSPDQVDLNKVWHALTDEQGRFVFPDVPVGTYRMVAQAWPGVVGVPDRKDDTVVVDLHGVADGIVVRENETVPANVQALGHASLRVQNDPQEANAYLLVSTGPMAGDPILAFVAWGKPFLTNVIAVTHMGVPHVTLNGLPDDRSIHASLFAYDNVPGMGGFTARPGRQDEAILKIYSGWSNGKYDPPERLLPLVEHLEGKSLTLPQLIETVGAGDLNIGWDDFPRFREYVLANADKQIDLGEAGKHRLTDVLAAYNYAELRKIHRRREKR